MKKFCVLTALVFFLAAGTVAQTRRTVRRPPAKPATPAIKPVTTPQVDRGYVSGRTYTNKTFAFEVTFPDTWIVAGDDFGTYMKSHGVDVSVKTPRGANPQAQSTVNAAIKRLTVLLTAFRYLPGAPDNAVVRIAVEDIRNLNTDLPVKDGVDYIDLMRQSYKILKMPADYKYSETQAEQLGSKQFAFIDTSTAGVKTRVYATVRNGFAILISLNYSKDEDLDTFREILAKGNFSLK